MIIYVFMNNYILRHNKWISWTLGRVFVIIFYSLTAFICQSTSVFLIDSHHFRAVYYVNRLEWTTGVENQVKVINVCQTIVSPCIVYIIWNELICNSVRSCIPIYCPSYNYTGWGVELPIVWIAWTRWLPHITAFYCPACRTSLIATRFWVVMICPIIKCLTV